MTKIEVTDAMVGRMERELRTFRSKDDAANSARRILEATLNPAAESVAPVTEEMLGAGALIWMTRHEAKWPGDMAVIGAIYRAMRKVETSSPANPLEMAESVAVGQVLGRVDGLIALHVGGSVAWLDKLECDRLGNDLFNASHRGARKVGP